MNIEQKIFHYYHTKWNIPFRELRHTIETVCEFVKPIYPSINPLKYFEYFFREIDFDKIENNTNKAETLKYCNAIYYGLEQLLKADISNAILIYQNKISRLPKEQIQETQIKLIELIGNLKRQARTNEAGISFGQRYIVLYKGIEAKDKLNPIDYQILISHFNETIVNDLLSSFGIINDTFKEIAPLLTTLPPQQTETKTEQEKPEKFIANEYALAYIFDLFANGQQIPVNRSDGGFNKKELIKVGIELYKFEKGKDTFYRAVKHVSSFDLNKLIHLQSISKGWIEAVKKISKDWNKTQEYLRNKKLIRE